MKVVVDTNVLVSAFLSSQGSPSAIMQMIMSGLLRVCYDMRILNEYAGVLERPKFLISPALSAQFLDHVRTTGELITAAPALLTLPDASDRAFLEVALTAHAACLITGNLKHFPPSCRMGMPVLAPAEFMAFYRGEPPSASGTVKSPSEEYRVCRRSMNKSKKLLSPRRARPMSFAKFTRTIDGTLSASDVNWTPEEVKKVIRSIRRGKARLKTIDRRL
jgi:putative PIN family toxin of toxin-antitoxin system